ncbi:MAG: DUF1491 family protein [Salinarimonadaceae bacterium]|nr:MAG: DUF1491 family protein [Salinarimonadaceae bacterium]
MRLRSDFFAAALIRRCAVEGVVAVQRRRGSSESGAIFVKVDRLDGTADLYGPAPQSLMEEGDATRRFAAVMREAPAGEVEEKMRREARFDPDLWLIEIEDREGRCFLDLAE